MSNLTQASSCHNVAVNFNVNRELEFIDKEVLSLAGKGQFILNYKLQCQNTTVVERIMGSLKGRGFELERSGLNLWVSWGAKK